MHNIRQPNPKTKTVNNKTSQQCFDEIFGFVMVFKLTLAGLL